MMTGEKFVDQARQLFRQAGLTEEMPKFVLFSTRTSEGVDFHNFDAVVEKS